MFVPLVAGSSLLAARRGLDLVLPRRERPISTSLSSIRTSTGSRPASIISSLSGTISTSFSPTSSPGASPCPLPPFSPSGGGSGFPSSGFFSPSSSSISRRASAPSICFRCYPACALLVGIYLKERWYVLVEKRWTTAILCIFGPWRSCVAPRSSVPCHAPRAPARGDVRERSLLSGRPRGHPLPPRGLAFLLSILRRAPGKGFLALFIYLVSLGFLYHSLYLPALDRSTNPSRLITDADERLPKRRPRSTCTASTLPP